MKKIWMTDYHGCLSTYPEFFQKCSGELHVISGSTVHTVSYILKRIKTYKLKVAKLHILPEDIVRNHKYKWLITDIWKVNTIKKVNPDYYFDDEESIIRQIFQLRMAKEIKTLPFHIYAEKRILDDAVNEFLENPVKDDKIQKKLLQDMFKI